MERKPQDLLEFLRKTSRERAGVPPAPETTPAEGLEPTPRMVILRRSQVVVAGVGAGLAVVLAFLLGLALGGGAAVGTVETVGPWVVRVITFKDTEQGRRRAKSILAQLEKLGLGEVSLQRIPSEGQLVVTCGAWINSPQRNAKARALRDRIRSLALEKTGARPFQDADFWRIGR